MRVITLIHHGPPWDPHRTTPTLRRGADTSRAETMRDRRAIGLRARSGAPFTRLVRRGRELLAVACARLATGLILMAGVALALAGLGLTGGSFGLLAFIGMPLLIIGLGLISAAQSIVLAGSAGSAGPVAPSPPAFHRSPTIPTPGAMNP